MVTTKSKFVAGPILSHQSLCQSSSRVVHYGDNIHGPTTINVNAKLPPFVLPYYWLLAKLSFVDILKQAEDIPARFFWISALMYGIDIGGSSIRTSLSSYDQNIVAAKPTAIHKILKAQQITLSAENNLLTPDVLQTLPTLSISGNNFSILDFVTLQQHRPKVPLLSVPAEKFMEALHKQTTSHALSICSSTSSLLPQQTKIKKEERVQLVEVENYFFITRQSFPQQQLLLLNRVVPQEAYQKAQKQVNSCLGTIPYTVQSDNGLTYVLVEDVLFVRNSNNTG
jgi:hypothetical protein